MFVAVLVLLIVINLRQVRQDAKEARRRKVLGAPPAAPESIMDITAENVGREPGER